MRPFAAFLSQDKAGLFVIARKATEEEIGNFVSQFPDEPFLPGETPVILDLAAVRQTMRDIDAMADEGREHAAINSGIEPA